MFRVRIYNKILKRIELEYMFRVRIYNKILKRIELEYIELEYIELEYRFRVLKIYS